MPSISVPTIIAGTAAAGSLASGIMNSNATSDAANAQVAAADRSAQVQQNIFDKTQSNLAPFLNTGTQALSQLAGLLGIGGGGASGPNNSALYGVLQNYPGYQFSFNEGLRALNQSGAARGLLNSGATIQNATKFGQGMAQGVLGDYLNRLGGLVSTGENAGANVGNIGASTGANIGNALIQGGNAAGSGIMGSSLALTGGINGALNNSMLAYRLSQGGGAGPGWGSYTGDFSEFM